MKYSTGVYQWRNLVNGKVYIGGAYKSFEQRKGEHLYALDQGFHFNRHLQRAWKKYGREGFIFEILERCLPNDVLACEQKWLDQLRPYEEDIGYNICPNAQSYLGVKESEETKTKKSQAIKRRYAEDLTYRQRSGGKNRGMKRTEELKIRLSEIHKKRLSDPVERNKYRDQALRPEVRAKKSAAAKKQWENEEHRADISRKNREANARQFADPEKRAKHKAAVEAWAIRTYGSVEAWKEHTRERNRARVTTKKKL